MTSSHHNRAERTPISYKHEPSPAHHLAKSLDGSEKQRKRHRKAVAEHLEKQALEQEHLATDEGERMWHRGYMMALKDVLMLFDDTRVPKT
jgi:hypothetical protein